MGFNQSKKKKEIIVEKFGNDISGLIFDYMGNCHHCDTLIKSYIYKDGQIWDLDKRKDTYYQDILVNDDDDICCKNCTTKKTSRVKSLYWDEDLKKLFSFVHYESVKN